MVSFFEQAALRLIGDHPRASVIAKTFAAVHQLVEEKNWQGACHATTAVTFVLLAAQGIKATACLGEVMLGHAAFDHSWIEIEGRVFDIAIERPLMPEMAATPVISGRHIDSDVPTAMTYGAISGVPPQGPAAMIARMSFGEYMDGFPDHAQGLWGVVSELAERLGLLLNAEDLRRRYGNSQWTRRAS
jgi:hypothetical protein